MLTWIHHITMMLNRRSSSSPIDVHTQGGTSKIHHTDILARLFIPFAIPSI